MIFSSLLPHLSQIIEGINLLFNIYDLFRVLNFLYLSQIIEYFFITTFLESIYKKNLVSSYWKYFSIISSSFLYLLAKKPIYILYYIYFLNFKPIFFSINSINPVQKNPQILNWMLVFYKYLLRNFYCLWIF